MSIRQGFARSSDPRSAITVTNTYMNMTAPMRPYPPPPPPPQPAQQERRKIEWPPSVRQYVQRSFAVENTIESVCREEMEVKLKQVITEAAEDGTLERIDWQSLLLPQQLILRDRMKTVQQPVARGWENQISQLNVQETNTNSNRIGSKKRKLVNSTSPEPVADSQPPWRHTNQRNVLEDRVTFADKRQRKDFKENGNSKSHNNLDQRQRRFEGGPLGVSTALIPREVSPPDVDQGPVIGKCEDLEKRYFRLTAAPNPDTVRPLRVLKKTLDLLKRKWQSDNNYGYICDQFKSLRQDLTVQRIKTDFTVSVYEIHARIALEKGDLGEYNQCQTQLRALYAQNLGGHPVEFKAYRILYFIHTSNRTDMNDILADLSPEEKEEPAIKHALDARSALALGNYHRFFKLYLETPNMGGYLMDMFVARERLSALANICKAYVFLSTSPCLSIQVTVTKFCLTGTNPMCGYAS